MTVTFDKNTIYQANKKQTPQGSIKGITRICNEKKLPICRTQDTTRNVRNYEKLQKLFEYQKQMHHDQNDSLKRLKHFIWFKKLPLMF